jgi:hypothetical protein
MEPAQRRSHKLVLGEGMIMTRNWIATASHALKIARNDPARPRRRSHRRPGATLQLENLEQRLSLSLSHTVAPSAQLLPAVQVAPLIKHGWEPAVVQSQSDDLFESGPLDRVHFCCSGSPDVVPSDESFSPDSGKRQYKPFVDPGVASESAVPKKTIEAAWIQGQPGEDAVLRKH